MARKTTVLGFSVSPALAKEYQQIAEREGTTKSDLFRRMVTTYKAEREEEEFFFAATEDGTPRRQDGNPH
jgi:metal-responsive CopG/Arc/MetJ family transcriptional regulator